MKEINSMHHKFSKFLLLPFLFTSGFLLPNSSFADIEDSFSQPDQRECTWDNANYLGWSDWTKGVRSIKK